MAEQPARTLRILVVEDDTETLLATMELLELLGHRATGVRSAEAASDRFLEGFFDLLFVDLNLPGLSGMDLVKKLRSRERLPVIVASGAGPRFQELEQGLPGLAPNTLSSRLKSLESQGVIATRLYESHPPRYEYFLTEKGKALGPVLKALHGWGERFGS